MQFLHVQHEKKMLGLFARIILMLIPAIVFGYYLDFYINLTSSPQKKITLASVCIQTLSNIFVMFVFTKIYPKFAEDIQSSIAGLFFVSMYFNMQTNYIKNIQRLLS